MNLMKCKKNEKFRTFLNQILEQKKYEKNLIINLNSKIIKSFADISFIIERIKNNNKYKDKAISLNLLYKATRDGVYHQISIKNAMEK